MRLLELMMPAPIPERPVDNPLRKACYDICIPWDKHDPFTHGSHSTLHYMRNYFQDFILGCLVVNLALMCSKHTGQPGWWGDVLVYQDIVFICIFVLELGLKCVALLPYHYFKDPWQCFDAFIVLGALLVWPFTGDIADVMQRAFRALRVVRLVNASPRLRLIGTTLTAAGQRVLYVLALVMLLMAAYGVLGVHMFSDVRHGVVLGRHNNFADFGAALRTLFAVVLGDWVYLRYDCQVAAPHCTVGKDCGSSWSALYFFSFVLLARYIALNLVVAVVMESFTWLYSMERTAVTHDLDVSVDDLRAFQSEWERLDPLARGTIPITDLQVLLHRLPEPFGRPELTQQMLAELREVLESLPGHQRGRIRFRDLFVVLTTAAMSQPEEEGSADTTDAKVVPVWREMEVQEGAGIESRPVSRQDIVADVSESVIEEQGTAGPSDDGKGVTAGGDELEQQEPVQPTQPVAVASPSEAQTIQITPAKADAGTEAAPKPES